MCLLGFSNRYLAIIFFILNVIKLSSTLVSSKLSYSQNGPCQFTLNSGAVIDLSSLLKSNEPLIASTSASLYIFHPCGDVPLNTKIANECQKSYGLCYFVAQNPENSPLDYNKVLSNVTQGNFSLLGLNDELLTRENRLKELELVYKHRNSHGVIVSTYVQLECDEKIKNFTLSIGRTSAFEHMLMLTSSHNCLVTPHYMSGGTVFFVILIVLFLVYFLGGILVLRFIRGATGIEMIPNHEFWCNLCSLPKNGLTYLANCRRSTPDSYEKI